MAIKSSQSCKIAAHLKVNREHFHLFFFSIFRSTVLRVFIINFLYVLHSLICVLLSIEKKVTLMFMKMEVTDARDRGTGDAMMYYSYLLIGAVQLVPLAW